MSSPPYRLFALISTTSDCRTATKFPSSVSIVMKFAPNGERCFTEEAEDVMRTGREDDRYAESSSMISTGFSFDGSCGRGFWLPTTRPDIFVPSLVRTVTCCHSKTSVMVLHSGRYPGASFFFTAGAGSGATYFSIVVRRSLAVG